MNRAGGVSRGCWTTVCAVSQLYSTSGGIDPTVVYLPLCDAKAVCEAGSAMSPAGEAFPLLSHPITETQRHIHKWTLVVKQHWNLENEIFQWMKMEM